MQQKIEAQVIKREWANLEKGYLKSIITGLPLLDMDINVFHLRVQVILHSYSLGISISTVSAEKESREKDLEYFC